MSSEDRYDLIVVGSGGGALSQRLADASFFVSIGAVNPTLTIIANALRVADRIKERMGATDQGAASTARTTTV